MTSPSSRGRGLLEELKLRPVQADAACAGAIRRVARALLTPEKFRKRVAGAPVGIPHRLEEVHSSVEKPLSAPVAVDGGPVRPAAEVSLDRTPRRFSRASWAVVTAVGLLVLAGWAFGMDALRGPIPGLITMKANTALGLSLMGGVLYVSGYTEDLVARQGVVEDGVLLVEQPFAAEQLLAAVEEAPEFPVSQASPR